MKSSKGKLLLVYCVIFLSLALAACGATGNGQARTYYESLDLSTVEKAVTTFTNAFNKNDFPTVWLVLAPKAQLLWYQRLLRMNIAAIVDSELWDTMIPEITVFSQGLGYGEHSDYDGGFLFDEVMLAANHHDAFLIDLHGDLHILSSKESTTADGEACVNVVASVGNLESITFRMIQAPSGRWRVLQVIVPGGDEEQIPWSVPSE
jgi:hypothetical protein